MADINDIIKEVSPWYKTHQAPAKSYVLEYDSPTESLEPVYFWILDFMKKMFKKMDKLQDTFASSPGGGHFSDIQGKASQMQQEASRVLGTVNNILKGIINLIYDLKEFQIRLSHYDAAKSSDSKKKEAGTLALKQMWMDKVDVQRGQGSINALTAGDLNFVTLRDAFLAAKSSKDVDKMDLNERVKRILKPRLLEFEEWQGRSETELRKRFEIEKTYLKGQVNALKLNSRWAKPYLKAAEQLKASEGLNNDPALVTVFNTIIIDLVLMGSSPINIEKEVIAQTIPRSIERLKTREYFQIVIVDFKFRGIPTKQGQHFSFGGKVDVTFKGYCLNEDEIALMNDKLSDSDLNTALKYVQGMTDESLEELKMDIDEFIDEAVEEKEKQANLNPFSALFKTDKKNKKPDKDDKEAKLKKLKEYGVKKDTYAEKYIRAIGEADAKNSCFKVYDIYKKGHGMAAFPSRDDDEPELP